MGDVLWNLRDREIYFAQRAIDSYIDKIKIFEEKDRQNPNNRYGRIVLNSIIRSFYISLQTKYKRDEVKNELIRLVLNFPFVSQSSFLLRSRLINLMLNNRRVFSKDDFKKVNRILSKIANDLLKEGNIHAAIDMYKLGKRVDKKTRTQYRDWDIAIARAWEKLFKEALNMKDNAAGYFCQNAIQYYKLAGNHKKINELEKRFQLLKKDLKFHKFSTKIDLTDYHKWCVKVAKELCENSPDEIIQFLCSSPDILPVYDELEKQVKKNAKAAPLIHMISNIVYDKNRNPVQHFVSDEEKLYFHILEQYKHAIQLEKMYLINEIITQSYLSGKFTFENLILYLQEYSWIGKNLSKYKDSDGNSIVYNWIDVISPSLLDYFTNLKMVTYSQSNIFPNFVLFIDSLSTKIEGLLRDMCYFSGVTTFYQRKDRHGKDIVQEKELHKLLYEDALKQIFSEDDSLFLKYLLVEQAGFNLRNEVAHSQMNYEEYNFNTANLLLIALFRIAKYDLHILHP